MSDVDNKLKRWISRNILTWIRYLAVFLLGVAFGILAVKGIR